jgi:hypothetical protein
MMAPDYVYETIFDGAISGSTAAPVVDLAGFREFSILARIEGAASATVRMEINQGNILVQQENLELGLDGWQNFAKSYTVFAPSLGIVLYHPSSMLKVHMTIYAGH